MAFKLRHCEVPTDLVLPGEWQGRCGQDMSEERGCCGGEGGQSQFGKVVGALPPNPHSSLRGGRRLVAETSTNPSL